MESLGSMGVQAHTYRCLCGGPLLRISRSGAQPFVASSRRRSSVAVCTSPSKGGSRRKLLGSVVSGGAVLLSTTAHSGFVSMAAAADSEFAKANLSTMHTSVSTVFKLGNGIMMSSCADSARSKVA